MNKNRWIRIMLITAAAVCMAGCGKSRETGQETLKESEPETKVEAQTQTSTPETTKLIRLTEHETESETQKLITSVEYTSKDGTVKITLPDNTWKVTQDADEMRVFSSGSDAMINIVHASTESAMKTLSIQKTKDDLESALTKQYSDANAYEIQSFESQKVENVDVYRYVVKYNATARMWAYSVTYGIVAPDQAYVITGTVTDDNSTLLKAVEDSVDSFTVLKDEELMNVTAAPLTAGVSTTGAATGSTTAATTAQTDQNGNPTTGQTTTSADENGSLAAYGSTVNMYASDIVNIRSGPGTDTNVVGGFSAGDVVTVTGETNGWYQVNVNGTTGYIRKDLLSSTQTATAQTTAQTDASQSSTAGGTNYDSAVTMYATDGVNVRSQPSTSSDVSGTLDTGTPITVIGESNGWYIVSTGSGTGYVSGGYLSTTAPTSTASTDTSSTSSSSTASSTTPTGTATAEDQSNAGSATGASGYVSGVVLDSNGSTMTILGDDGNTYSVNTGGADISTSEGIYSGLYVNVGYSVNSDGSLSASDITG